MLIRSSARPPVERSVGRGVTLKVACPLVRQDADMAKVDVTITLTGDEALVLFELLHRWEDDDRVTAPQHRAERIALWNLSALLEQVLVEPFKPEYARLVSESRERLTPAE